MDRNMFDLLSYRTETVSDILKIQNSVFSMIPFVDQPYTEPLTEPLEFYAEAFMKNEIGGWCGLNAHFFNEILKNLGVSCFEYNYGFKDTPFTHVCVIISLDGISFLLDPYFNRIYTYKDDFFLTFPDLLRLIQERKLDCIKSRYGDGKKRVFRQGMPSAVSGYELESEILSGFEAEGLRKKLMDFFNSDNPLLLMLLEANRDPLAGSRYLFHGNNG